MRDALEEAIGLTSGPGNGTTTRTRPIEEWRRLDRLFRAALNARSEPLDYEVAAESNRFGEPGEPYQVPVRSEPGAEGLDVERLARSWWAAVNEPEDGPWEDASEQQRKDALGWADTLMREYAALAETEPKP